MLVTPADVTAALNRIADVADPEDVNMVRAELARLRLVLDAGEDDDVDYARWDFARLDLTRIVGGTDTDAWLGDFAGKVGVP